MLYGTTHWMLVACKLHLVCLCPVDNVPLPGGELSVARAAWTPKADYPSSIPFTVFQQ